MNSADNLLEQLLSQALASSNKNTLWCVDEHTIAEPVFAGHIICKRYEHFLNLKALNEKTAFNDFDFSGVSNGLERIIFRVSKEKAINLHIIQQSLQKLSSGGELLFFGYK